MPCRRCQHACKAGTTPTCSPLDSWAAVASAAVPAGCGSASSSAMLALLPADLAGLSRLLPCRAALPSRCSGALLSTTTVDGLGGCGSARSRRRSSLQHNRAPEQPQMTCLAAPASNEHARVPCTRQPHLRGGGPAMEKSTAYSEAGAHTRPPAAVVASVRFLSILDDLQASTPVVP